jgi:hypothetical protein
MVYAVTMDVSKMLAELRQEHEKLGEVILGLERLALGQGKRRGRPPAWLKAAAASSPAEASAPKKRGRPKGSKNKSSAA